MGTPIVIPTALVTETVSAFNARVVRNKNRPASYGDTAVFRNEDTGQNVVVGSEALQTGQPMRITGSDKYVTGVLENLILAPLVKLLPDGYPNLYISCGHTTNAIPYVDQMASILNRKHTVTRYDGKTVKYGIRGFIPWDEPAGGILRWAHLNLADNQVLNIGENIIVLDIGGKISSMYAAEVIEGGQIQIYWSSGSAFNVGIQDVLHTLEQEFRSLYPDVFRAKNIGTRILEEALTHPDRSQRMDVRYFTTVKGDQVEVTQAVLNATGSILDQIERVWTNDMDSGIRANKVVVTGGGGGRLYDMVVQDVLDHNHVFPADVLPEIHLANLRGGVFASKVWFYENYEKLFRKINGHVYHPVMLGIDPGNTNTKAELITRDDLG